MSSNNMPQGSANSKAPNSPHPPPAPAPASQPHYQRPPQHHQQPQQQQHQQQHQQPTSQQVLDSNKRAAMAGQWRTPPLPVFPTSAPPTQHQQHHQQQPGAPQSQPPPPAQQAGLPPPTNLPHNSEDYAKALQEAYRRGAEAAAAMAAQQPHIAPSVSCPNFQMSMAPAPPPPPQQQQQPPAQQQQQPLVTCRSEEMTTSAPPQYAHGPPPPNYHTQYVDPNSMVAHHNHAAPPPGAAPHHAPPPPQHHQQHQQQHQQPLHPYAQPPPSYVAPAQQQQPPTAMVQGVAPAPGNVPNPLTNMPPPPKQPPTQQNAHPQPPAPPASAAQIVNPPPQQRSVSLPDMTSYAVQAEEEKRQKRLARNRASARLRRLRKKNLVDAYETEVGILEKTLQQLKAHEWGVPTTNSSGPAAAAATASSEKSHQSLLEALCMDRGQQVISSEQRAEQCQDILEQQLQQMELLRQVQFEQQLLAATVGENKEDDPEMAQMAQELNDVLGLSDEQKSELQGASNGLDEEMTALDTVFSSLVMMKENEWLMNEGVQDITDQLTSILHKNQMSKFLLWADANVEAIDQLDHVHAAPKTAPHPQGPIFTFGVETTPMEDDGDGK